jgi:methylated-DNA-[protein]-cysteine S-methyltransferase
MDFAIQEYKSPVGVLKIVATEKKLHAIVFAKNWSNFKDKFDCLVKKENAITKKAKLQLDQYFSGKRKDFDLPIILEGTEFQNRVWQSLNKIPFGTTSTYKQQAKSIKSEKAVRAVGRTNGLNPLCVILPCHRVIGSDGSLTGYAGGINAKKMLLKLEGVI